MHDVVVLEPGSLAEPIEGTSYDIGTTTIDVDEGSLKPVAKDQSLATIQVDEETQKAPPSIGTLAEPVLITSKVAIRGFFRQFLRSPEAIRTILFKAMVRYGKPELILTIAFEDYEELGGDEKLALADSVLEAQGVKAHRTLWTLATNDSPYLEYFVGTIAHLRGVTSLIKLALFMKLARSRDVDVRLRLLDHSDQLGVAHRKQLVERLSKDTAEIVSTAAQSILENLD